MSIIPLMMLLLAFLLFCLGVWLAPDPKPFNRFACAGLAAYTLAQIVTLALAH